MQTAMRVCTKREETMTWCRKAGPAVGRLIAVCLIVIAAARMAAAAETYDLLFKSGTLDAISRETVLIYERRVSARANEEIASRESGTVRLAFAPDDMAELTFRQGERHRTIGSFPAGVGNPIILYFVESVVRDMAATSGGSPFYIRNRIKAALELKNPVHENTLKSRDAEFEATTVTLHPFADDPNQDRMMGFEDLTLTVVMSDRVTGWYYELRAETASPGQTSGASKDGPVYTNSIRFHKAEVEE